MNQTPSPTPLPPNWVLPEAIRNRVGREAGPQRSMLEEGHLLIILHRLPGPDDWGRTPVFFHRTPEGCWRGSESRALGPSAPAEFLAVYENRLHELEEAETRAASASQFHTLLESGAPVLRAARGLHRALQQAREMVRTDRDLINFRDRAAGIERGAELLLQDAQFGLTYTAARQAEAQAESAARMAVSAHRLNILAALFLPLTALTGVLGMDQPLSAERWTPEMLLLVGGGVLAGLVMAVLVARRRAQPPV